ncbi:hypothetical protein TNCV_3865211 [Trichonephila clavipes]|nr:hypothetical protein TNCV_3865211 [Trichonephila clavipes]
MITNLLLYRKLPHSKEKTMNLNLFPPNRKLSKTKILHWLLIKNFKINLSNKFNALEIHDSEIDPVEGTSTATSVNNANAVNNKKNPQPMPSLINQRISRRTSPPVMLKITLDFREQMRGINNFMPKNS